MKSLDKTEIKRTLGKISRLLMKTLLISGAVILAGSTPQGSRAVWKLLKYQLRKIKYKRLQKLREEQWKNSFYYLKRNNLLKMEYRGKQLYVSLTEEGKKLAKKCKIDDLKIKKPRKWDKKWHLLFFDIGEKDRPKREAFRGKIKELGLYKLQKSIWIHPFDFSPGIAELEKFFRFKENELIVIIAENIPNEKLLKEHFKLV